KWITVANVSASKNSYTHSNNKKTPLAAGSKYVYTVRAYNKTSRKWGAYNTNGVIVTVPKKNAPAPTQPAKPTAVPTQKPKPTTPVIPSPSPEDTPDISGPTSTPTPAPAKPTEAPKPTATPVPAKPTATPAPVKVSNVTVNPATVKLTSKGQNIQLSVSVLPNNAENKSIVWSTSNASVATVDNNGVVTAVANGNATITAAALDGSGKRGSCTVTVEIPDENSRIITVQGGRNGSCYIAPGEFDGINLQNVEMEIQGNNDIIDIGGKGYDSSSWCAFVDFKAQRKGSVSVIAKYENRILRRWTINVTSDWDEYIGYVNWRKQIENQIWTTKMTSKDKMKTAESYIKTHYGYKNGSSDAIKVYLDKSIDCHAATKMIGDFAKDINLQVKYINAVTGNTYDYIVEATSEGGHTYNLIYVDNNWEKFDATPIP
ncbi:hypothetical protein DWX77_16645, partial [Blautia obeum]